MIINKLTNILLYIMLLLSIISCFLPFFSFTIDDVNNTYNFFNNNGEFSNGIIIIVMQLFAIILSILRKRNLVVIIEAITCSVFAFLMYNIYINFSDIDAFKNYSILAFLDKGFYLFVISLIGSSVFAIIASIKE